jgi:hypothetical protein
METLWEGIIPFNSLVTGRTGIGLYFHSSAPSKVWQGKWSNGVLDQQPLSPLCLPLAQVGCAGRIENYAGFSFINHQSNHDSFFLGLQFCPGFEAGKLSTHYVGRTA